MVVVLEWVYRLSMHFLKYVCVSNAVSKCKAPNLLLILNTVALTSNEAQKKDMEIKDFNAV